MRALIILISHLKSSLQGMKTAEHEDQGLIPRVTAKVINLCGTVSAFLIDHPFQRFPLKLCLIKYDLDIDVYTF